MNSHVNKKSGSVSLTDWLKSSYCCSKGITKATVADVIRNAIENSPKLKMVEK